MDISTFDLAEWVLWIAQDEDGVWWGYECEPHQHDSGWYENEVGRCIKLVLTKVNPDWRLTLQKVSKD